MTDPASVSNPMPQHELATDARTHEEPPHVSNLMQLRHANARGLGVDPFEPDAADLAGVSMYRDEQVIAVVAAHGQRLHQHRGHLDRIANFAQGLPQREEIDALMADAKALHRQMETLFDTQAQQAATIRDLLQVVQLLRQKKVA